MGVTMDNVFDKARQIIRERGWITGINEDTEGHVCLTGALNIAETGTAERSSTGGLWHGDYSETIETVIKEQFPGRIATGGAMPFNDHPLTTLSDIDLVLDKCARITDERVEP